MKNTSAGFSRSILWRVIRAMWRAGLTIYLVLATVAGPWFCCCTTFRLLDWLIPAPAEEEGPVPACSCCCESSPAIDAPSHDDSQQPSQPPLECPCQQQRSETVAMAAPAPERAPVGELPLDPIDCPAFLANDLRPLSISSAPDRREGRIAPFLSADELLYDLHRLRC